MIHLARRQRRHGLEGGRSLERLASADRSVVTAFLAGRRGAGFRCVRGRSGVARRRAGGPCARTLRRHRGCLRGTRESAPTLGFLCMAVLAFGWTVAADRRQATPLNRRRAG